MIFYYERYYYDDVTFNTYKFHLVILDNEMNVLLDEVILESTYLNVEVQLCEIESGFVIYQYNQDEQLGTETQVVRTFNNLGAQVSVFSLEERTPPPHPPNFTGGTYPYDSFISKTRGIYGDGTHVFIATMYGYTKEQFTPNRLNDCGNIVVDKYTPAGTLVDSSEIMLVDAITLKNDGQDASLSNLFCRRYH
jgi:hypothetical protein